MSEKNLFGFIEHLSHVAAINGQKMEELIYTDPGSAIFKARLFAEEILNKVFNIEEIEEPYVSTFYQKLTYMVKEGYLTKEPQKAFDSIRFTGNKAAHDGRFNDINEALKLHKVMYDVAVWFFELYSSKAIEIPIYQPPKPKTSNIPNEGIQEIVKKQILDIMNENKEIMKTNKEGLNPMQLDDSDEHETTHFTETFETNKENQPMSYGDGQLLVESPVDVEKGFLLRELKRLQDSSQEAVESVEDFSRFKRYMHVPRKIQTDLEEMLLSSKDDTSSLIFLCGSVGDGKSHLLGFLRENKPELLEEYQIYNDATESFSPNKNAMETLEEVLADFSDQKINSSQKKIIIAINLGVLHNFITRDHANFTFGFLKKFIEQSQLFSESAVTEKAESENMHLISFSDYHPYELTAEGPRSNFFYPLVEKIFDKNEQNPFFKAYKKDISNQFRTMVHDNYEFLQKSSIKEQIVGVIIQTIVKYKLVISARAFLNFMADIIIPDQTKLLSEITDIEKVENSVPNLLFNRKDRSNILAACHELDPINIRSEYIDQLIIKLNTLNDWGNIIDQYIDTDKGKHWLSPFFQEEQIVGSTLSQFTETLIRLAFLTNNNFATNISDQSYYKYVEYLYCFNSGNKEKIKEFYDFIRKAMFTWQGSPKKGYIYFDQPTNKIRLAQRLKLMPSINHLQFKTEETFESFKPIILLQYNAGSLEIDYPLYKMLLSVEKGYRPNKQDQEEAIKFVEFIEKAMHYGHKQQEILVHFTLDDRLYKLQRGDFDTFEFERGS